MVYRWAEAYFQNRFKDHFSCAFGAILFLFASFAMAENCMIYANDVERLRCFEENRHNAGGNAWATKESGAATPPQSKKESTRAIANGSKQLEVAPKERPEDVNAVLNGLAGRSERSDQAAAAIRQEKADAAWQSSRLINACATSYCQETLAPYQNKVDQYRGQGKSEARAEAEAELRWQFRMRANPP